MDENARFLATGFVGLVELAETAVLSSCVGKIERKFPSKLDEFKELAKGYQLGQKDREIIANCTQRIIAKHDMLTRFGPEILLGVVLSQYTLRQLALVRFVNNVTATPAQPKPQPPAES